MAREPIPWHVRSWYATFYLRALGNYAEARRESERALEDNPLSQVLHWLIANVCAGCGLHAEALAAYERAVELDPQFWVGLWTLGLHYAVSGRHAEAQAAAEKAFAIYPHPYNIGLLAGVFRNSGDTARVESLLQQTPDGSPGRSLGLASFHLAVGDVDQAVEWVGRALAEGYPMSANMVIWPFESHLRQSPGWPGLMKKMNLPETR
jgi:tetratricopeptide (TPR) repeat protein